MLTSSNAIASTYYRDREAAVASQAARIAARLPAQAIVNGDLAALKPAVSAPVTDGRVGMVEIYRVEPDPAKPRPDVVAIFALESPALPRGHVRASADLLAARVAAGSTDTQAHEPLDAGGELVRAGALARDANGSPVGVVIASDFLPGDLARHARRIAEAYEDYNQLRVLKRPLDGVYLSFFLMMTLLILVERHLDGAVPREADYAAGAACWRPARVRSARASSIIASSRRPATSSDRWSRRSTRWRASSPRASSKLERSTIDLERKNLEVDERRRYIETILERIATGVVSVDADGRVGTINAAARGCSTLDRAIVGAPAGQVFAREDLQPLAALIRSRQRRDQSKPAAQEIAIARRRPGDAPRRRPRPRSTARRRARRRGARVRRRDAADSSAEGRRVARRGAAAGARDQESADADSALAPSGCAGISARRRRPSRALVDECTTTIVGEVESLKGLVDEFSQFARMPAPRAVPRT